MVRNRRIVVTVELKRRSQDDVVADVADTVLIDVALVRIGDARAIVARVTQAVSVFVGVSGADLREGMYLRGEVTATEIEEAVALPRRMLVDQQAVYLVRDSVLQLQEVQVLKMNPETVVVRGLEDGAALLREPFPGAFDGMKVKVREREDAGAASGGEAGAVGMR